MLYSIVVNILSLYKVTLWVNLSVGVHMPPCMSRLSLFSIAASAKEDLYIRCFILLIQSGSGGRDFGRIEVCVSESWGTVCDDFWQNQDASAACRQLGFSEYGMLKLYQWDEYFHSLDVTL